MDTVSDPYSLDAIVNQYHESREFNGLSLRKPSDSDCDRVAELVEQGLVQVVGEEDYPNPHIRPWPSHRSIEQQISSVHEARGSYNSVCLYPTPAALVNRDAPLQLTGRPFSVDMAKGRGHLELEYFSFEVLEQYRNDPRFLFDFHDFGARATISDEAYLDPEEPEHDRIGLGHLGFAYDLTGYNPKNVESPIVRRVCAFYCDLAKLTDVHQQRWHTYRVGDSSGLHPHPVWWGSQMGHWPDGVGPFDRMFFELRALNELNELVCGVNLFRNTVRPDGFGWILRPSQREWESFVHELDKLLSDNLSPSALDTLGAPKKNLQDQQLGTLNRLEQFLLSKRVNAATAKEVLQPLREVRKARQGPAHAIRKNLTDKTYIHKQVALIRDVTQSLIALRDFWATHPKANGWQEPAYIQDGEVYRM